MQRSSPLAPFAFCILLAGCATGGAGPTSWHGHPLIDSETADLRGATDTCPIHRVRMQEKRVPVQYGLVGYAGGAPAYWEAREKRFPFSNSDSVAGGDLPTTQDPRFAVVWSCPDCERAELAYRKAHEGEPVTH